MIEQLNGEQYERKKPLAGGASGASSTATVALPPFILCKFDMSSSSLLRERYNISTMPMFLMYYNGKLAYASNTLNGYGSTKEDLIEQIQASTADAKRGKFLGSPERPFKFGSTSNKLTESFADTLNSTSKKLGADTHQNI